MSGLEWRLLILLILCLIPACWEARTALSHTAWVETWGTVKSFGDDYFDYTINTKGMPLDPNHRTYLENTRPRVDYTFTVDDKKYSGEQISLPHIWCFSLYPVNFPDKFHKGDKIRVKYEQSHPEQSCAPDAVWLYTITALYIGGVVFVVLAVALFIAMIPESEDPQRNRHIDDLIETLNSIAADDTAKPQGGEKSSDASNDDPERDSTEPK